MQNETVLGVDIGGSGMKAAIVDIRRGELTTERFRIETPQPATPPSMSSVFGKLVEHFDWSGPVGCTFPGVIRRQALVETAANLDKSWIDVDAPQLFGPLAPGCEIVMINDADAAGIAEMRLGAGLGVDGVVFMLTIGTGLGTAIFNNGVLVPNTELGHIEIAGVDAEDLASSRARKAEGLSIEVWAKRLETYLHRVEELLSPDLFIIGDGISKDFDQFAPAITTRARLEPARMRNHAGIVGAALASLH